MPEIVHQLQDSLQLLIKGCKAGDRNSQARVYNIYSRKMMGVCLWYSRNRQEAEEILQDGFMRVFTYINTFSGSGSFEGWIRKIMVNAALHRFRNKTHLKPVIELNPASDELPRESPYSLLDAKELINLVQSLPPAYRMVFNLHVLEGMKHREIAKLLGISEGTSKSNLSDARAILQKELSEYFQKSLKSKFKIAAVL